MARATWCKGVGGEGAWFGGRGFVSGNPTQIKQSHTLRHTEEQCAADLKVSENSADPYSHRKRWSGTPFELKRANPIGILQQVCLSEHAPCFAKGFQEGLAASCRPAIYPGCLVHHVLCGTPFKPKRVNPIGILHQVCLSEHAPCLAKGFQGGSGGPFAAQGLVHHVACGTPFDPKTTNPRGYLAASPVVTPYFALRKMFPGRVWQPLVGQPAIRISK